MFSSDHGYVDLDVQPLNFRNKQKWILAFMFIEEISVYPTIIEF